MENIKKKKSKGKKRGRRKPFNGGVNVKKIDDFYKAVNTIQVEGEEGKINLIDASLAPICENILRDLELNFDKKEYNGVIWYKVESPNRDIEVDLEIQELEDELLTDGQLF
jgi:hypothetical protein